jgi:hypothetical protein
MQKGEVTNVTGEMDDVETWLATSLPAAFRTVEGGEDVASNVSTNRF